MYKAKWATLDVKEVGWPAFSYAILRRYPDIDHGHPPTFPSLWTFLQDNSQGHFSLTPVDINLVLKLNLCIEGKLGVLRVR